jgi:carbonic anhydrase/acetyltransferase-like protein (isoleucine patch superfamily)
MLESYLGKNPVLDSTAWVHDAATVIGDVTLGADVSIWPGAVLRGDQGSIHVGAKSNIQDGTVVHATFGLSTTWVGEKVTVGHNAVLHGCRIEDRCLIGMGAIILDNAIIGSGSIVAAGALVLKGSVIPVDSLVLGNPAHTIRPLSPAQRQAIEEGWRAYVRLAGEYRQRDGR